MSIFTNLISAAIEGARASHGLCGAEDARLLARMSALLETIRASRGEEREALVARLRSCEQELAAHLERSGRRLLADAMTHHALEGELVEH